MSGSDADYITINEASVLLGITTGAVEKQIVRGKIKAADVRTVGRRKYIRRDCLPPTFTPAEEQNFEEMLQAVEAEPEAVCTDPVPVPDTVPDSLPWIEPEPDMSVSWISAPSADYEVCLPVSRQPAQSRTERSERSVRVILRGLSLLWEGWLLFCEASLGHPGQVQRIRRERYGGQTMRPYTLRR